MICVGTSWTFKELRLCYLIMRLLFFFTTISCVQNFHQYSWKKFENKTKDRIQKRKKIIQKTPKLRNVGSLKQGWKRMYFYPEGDKNLMTLWRTAPALVTYYALYVEQLLFITSYSLKKLFNTKMVKKNSLYIKW